MAIDKRKGLMLVGTGGLILLVLTCFLIIDNDDKVVEIIDTLINPSDTSFDEGTGTVTVILPSGETKTLENFNPTKEGILSIRKTQSYPNLIVKINDEAIEMPYFHNATPNNYQISATAFGYDNFYQTVNVDAGINVNDVLIKMDKDIVEESNEMIENNEVIDEPIGE